jgi:hypothetical protein
MGRIRMAKGNDMKSKILGLVAMGLLAAAMTAKAAMVTWNFQGTVDIIDVRGSIPSCVDTTTNNAFSFNLQFDTSAAIIKTEAGATSGHRYTYDGSSLSLRGFAGDCPEFQPQNGGSGSGMQIMDNWVDGNPRDGIFFGLVDTNNMEWFFGFRGPEYLDIFNGPSLPTDPDPRLLSLSRPWQFQICQPLDVCNVSSAYGTVTSISRVPEPGTLALLGLGLLGLGITKRRKAI